MKYMIDINGRKYLISIILAVFLLSGLSAQNTKKGFKLLEKADYEKSYEVFKEALAENNQDPASLLGLSVILADDKSPYFDLIEAWDHASQLKLHVDKLTPEETEYIGEYFYNTEARHISWPVKRKIDYAVETVEAKLIKYIREENNLELVYKVIEKFPDFRYYENVIHIRNQLEFRKYEKQNTLEGYMEFLKTFPEAAQVDKAIRYRNKLAFEKAALINTVQAYKDYLRQYPDAVENNLAIKNLYAAAFLNAKKLNTIAALDEFIADYPDALEIAEAKIIQKQLLYEYAKKIQTMAAYNEFIRKYPEGQQYIDIFNLKSLDYGMTILGSDPLPSNNIQWARSFDEENNTELSACMTVDTLNNYILGGTVFRSDTGSTDAWILKLSSDGKMIWNKYVGEGYNDEVILLGINNHNEILGAGYTWTGTDSSSRESWLFKLGPDGQKLWSKKLGKIHLNTMLPGKAGNIYLGGYQAGDSLQRNYSILVLNENGRRLWSRVYTGSGEITSLNEFPDQSLLITGTHWHAKTDAKGYINWESSFNVTDSIVAAQILPGGEVYYAGYRDRYKLILIKTNQDNKSLSEQELFTGFATSKVLSFLRCDQSQLIILWSNDSMPTLSWVGIPKNEIIKFLSLPVSLNINSVVLDRSKNFLLTGSKENILIIKNNGLAF